MSSGPLIPASRCTSIELKDLADLLQFEVDGEAGTIYGLELTNEGFYRRSQIVTTPPPPPPADHPRLDELKQFKTRHVKEGLEYVIVKNEGKWGLKHLPLKFEWQIKFEFISPNTLVRSDNVFKKALNAGPLLVSLLPDKDSENKIEVKAYGKNNYLLHRIEDQGDVAVFFKPEIQIQNTMTMIIDFVVKKPNGSKVELMEGVTITWSDLNDEGKKRIVLFIRKEDRTFEVRSSQTLKVDGSKSVKMKTIILNEIDLLGFYFTDQIFTADEMEVILEGLNAGRS